jgi:protein-S-isoprenylcysteine O-methyltransferase Ste14
MMTESTFRAVVIASLTVCLPVALYFRIKSQATGEHLARREEGVVILVGLRLCGLSAWIVMFAYLLDAAWVSRFSVALPVWLRCMGVPLALVVAPILLFWTFHSLGKNLTDTVVTRREHTLVTHGPYRWVRHPFYDVVFLWGLSLTLLSANWLLGILVVTALTMLVIRTRIEEAKLAERFGDEYRVYARRTGKFFPALGRGRQLRNFG